MSGHSQHPASFKDPSGFIFLSDEKIYRQVNKVYAEHYDHFIRSSLYELLQKNKMLLSHVEINENIMASPDWHLCLLPEPVKFWSYPYEWCFEQLKDAALLTLNILKVAVEKGMILKDATAFNIQFINGKPIFIDTLSFEKYDESVPWTAYRQFCENFLFPLWLAHYHKMNFQSLISIYHDGIPAAVTAKLLPAKSMLSFSVWLHVRLQNRMSKKNSSPKVIHTFSKKKMLNLANHLQSIIKNLDNNSKTNWSNYYSESVLGNNYLIAKEKIITDMLPQLSGNSILDLGANDGFFSLLLAENKFEIIAVDNDEQCINNLYKKIKEQNISGILPLCIDISNPTSASGFGNNERTSFNERIKPDAVMALALIHHLVIGKNIPLSNIAGYLNSITPQLIIEFIPKEDEKTQFLLRNKKDIYDNYTREHFESEFKKIYTIISAQQVAGTQRYIYLMKKSIA